MTSAITTNCTAVQATAVAHIIINTAARTYKLFFPIIMLASVVVVVVIIVLVVFYFCNMYMCPFCRIYLFLS